MSQADGVDAARLVANGIRNLRVHRGLTQLGLAERMGVDQSAVARWEDPKYRGWSLKTLQKVAVALNARLRIRLLEK